MPIRSLRISIASALVLATVALPAASADDAAGPRVQVQEPRAFGHRVGDVVVRELAVELPAGLALDEASLPAPGRVSHALELRALTRSGDGAGRLLLQLQYQLFAAPAQARVIELPALQLRFAASGGREELVRVDAWPVAMAPLAPENGLARRGLGELRPDQAPVARDTRVEHRFIALAAAVALSAAVWLGVVYFGLPWWGRRARPFQRAYRHLRAASRDAAGRPAAWRSLHAAFDRTAGRTLFADGVDDFLRQAPRFAPLREDIREFYARSQRGFFAVGGVEAGRAQDDWLLDFARACRDAERGLAA